MRLTTRVNRETELLQNFCSENEMILRLIKSDLDDLRNKYFNSFFIVHKQIHFTLRFYKETNMTVEHGHSIHNE